MNIIKELCVRHGISQKQLAYMVGVSQPTVSDWCNNRANPSGERLDKLASIFGVSRAAILGYDDNEASAKPSAPISETEAIKQYLVMRLNGLSDAQLEKAYSYIKFLESEDKK